MTTYSYDRENRLISQNVDGNVTSFAYDGFGRKRRESRGVNPDVILNWDGDQMIVESSDLDPEAPSKAYYVSDGVIYAENANLGSRRSRRDYAVDFLGSVTGLTDSDASLSSVRRWSAYGKLLSGSSEPIGYFWTGNTGSRVYQSLGLNDNRARHYGRNIKQWITRDPLWPSELPYAYVNGNPVTRIDPSGLIPDPSKWFPICIGLDSPLTPCTSTGPRGGCPNQGSNADSVGPINISKFSDLQNQDESPLSTCDPKNVNLAAIQARIDEINLQIANLKHRITDFEDTFPEGGRDYIAWVETNACYTGTKRPFRAGCVIGCPGGTSALASKIKNAYYKGSKDLRGMGCIACCLMVHENYHCMQAMMTGSNNFPPSKELPAWEAELECLKRIKAGQKCR